MGEPLTLTSSSQISCFGQVKLVKMHVNYTVITSNQAEMIGIDEIEYNPIPECVILLRDADREPLIWLPLL